MICHRSQQKNSLSLKIDHLCSCIGRREGRKGKKIYLFGTRLQILAFLYYYMTIVIKLFCPVVEGRSGVAVRASVNRS